MKLIKAQEGVYLNADNISEIIIDKAITFYTDSPKYKVKARTNNGNVYFLEEFDDLIKAEMYVEELGENSLL